MTGWLIAGTGHVLNLALVTDAQVQGASNGTVRFYYGAPGGGSYVTVTMGASDADAEAALVRLVDAVDPADYS